MDAETYNIVIAVAGAVIVGLIWALYRLGISLRDMLPPALVPLLPVILNAMVDLAKQTPTTSDDELVEKIRELLNPTTPPAASADKPYLN